MPTAKQELGNVGEKLVAKLCQCPKCKRARTLKTLPLNFKCADIVCDFCGYLAQVKTSRVANVTRVPNTILGAAWKPQQERMDAGIFFPVFFVLISKQNPRTKAIYYLSADLQKLEMFVVRKPLSSSARRAGWQGFYYDMMVVQDAVVRIL